jgi:hypothetical protein
MEAGTLPNRNKIERQFKRALQPSLSNISVNWVRCSQERERERERKERLTALGDTDH